MLSWCIKRRAAVLGTTAGVLLVALFVHWIVPASGKAVRKAARPLSIPGPVKPPAAVVPPPLPPYPPLPMAGAVPPPTAFFPLVTPALDFTSKSIDQLLNDLDVVRATKGALDTQETKLIAVLRQKLAYQEQRLRKHGLMTAEGNVQSSVPVSPPLLGAAR